MRIRLKNMIRKKVVMACGCLLLATQLTMAAPLADLISAEPAEGGLSVTVPTGGCTAKTDFEVSAQPAPHGAARIEIRRLKDDNCKGNFPAGLKLLFTWSDLKLPSGTRLIVKNLQPQNPR